MVLNKATLESSSAVFTSVFHVVPWHDGRGQNTSQKNVAMQVFSFMKSARQINETRNIQLLTKTMSSKWVHIQGLFFFFYYFFALCYRISIHVVIYMKRDFMMKTQESGIQFWEFMEIKKHWIKIWTRKMGISNTSRTELDATWKYEIKLIMLRW